jgi:hypothetical protein
MRLTYHAAPRPRSPAVRDARADTSLQHDLVSEPRGVLVSRRWSGKTLTEHRADRASVVRQVLQAAGIDAPEADRLSADVLHEDGQPRFVWDDPPATGADYTEVLVASVMERRRWRTQYEAAKQAALKRDGPPVDNRSATATPTADRQCLDTPATGTR